MALLLSHAVPAWAGPGDAVEIELKGVQRGAVVEGALELSATASSPAGIKRVEISIGDQPAASAEPSGVKQSFDVSYGWVTAMQVDSTDLASNGEYVITATAVANGGADAVTTATVIVDNPAATPIDVSATVTSRGVELQWTPNPEPDLLGYQIERGVDGEFEVIGQTTDTSVIDAVGAGTYSYRVSAVRSSAARSTGRQSLPSEAVVVSIQGAAAGPPNGGGLQGADGLAGGRGFKVEGEAIAPQGLPAGVALPGDGGLPSLPVPGQKWGTFEGELPYDIPEGGIPLSAEAAAEESWTPIPADGLRWVAAGALLFALATLLRLFAQRLDAIAGPAPLSRTARSLKL
jgi:hypothetical protein